MLVISSLSFGSRSKSCIDAIRLLVDLSLSVLRVFKNALVLNVTVFSVYWLCCVPKSRNIMGDVSKLLISFIYIDVSWNSTGSRWLVTWVVRSHYAFCLLDLSLLWVSFEHVCCDFWSFVYMIPNWIYMTCFSCEYFIYINYDDHLLHFQARALVAAGSGRLGLYGSLLLCLTIWFIVLGWHWIQYQVDAVVLI